MFIRMKIWTILCVSCLYAAIAFAENASGSALKYSLEERVFELRLGRCKIRKGTAGMIELLKAEHARLPRPWTKSWIASISLDHKYYKCTPIVDEATAWAMIDGAIAEGGVHASLQKALGLINGTLPDKTVNPAIGAQLAILVAEAGYANAAVTVAHCYFYGVGVPRDPERAHLFAKRAAASSATKALNFMAHAYKDGTYGTPLDRKRAARLFYEEAYYGSNINPKTLLDLASAGEKEATKYLFVLKSDFIMEGSRLTNSEVKRIVESLEKDFPEDPEARVALGQILLSRRYHTYDPKKAGVVLKRAAEQGSKDAACHLAIMKLHGIGMATDEKTALEEIQRLADEGNRMAMAKLGWAYYWGPYTKLGTGKNPEKAYEYSRRAAELGDYFGMLNVGHCFKHGIGVPASNELAYWYYGLTATAGSRIGREEESRLEPFLKD